MRGRQERRYELRSGDGDGPADAAVADSVAVAASPGRDDDLDPFGPDPGEDGPYGPPEANGRIGAEHGTDRPDDRGEEAGEWTSRVL